MSAKETKKSDAKEESSREAKPKSQSGAGKSAKKLTRTQIMEAMEQKLGIKSGDTTSDLEFSLESVACFGCCALSPIIVVDDTVYSKITAEKAKQIVSSYE